MTATSTRAVESPDVATRDRTDLTDATVLGRPGARPPRRPRGPFLLTRLVAGAVVGLYGIAGVVAPHAVLPPAALPDVALVADTPPAPVVGPNTVIAPAAPASGASSAITASGKGDFAALKVTVSQTRDLINQVVHVTWTGATPTVGDSTNYVFHYLQIMQCWGDDASGPDRTQCQFGGFVNIDKTRAGEHVTSRRITLPGATFIDKDDPVSVTDPVTKQVTAFRNGEVPFYSVKGTVAPIAVPGSFSDFDANTTNEVDLARTTGDGKGDEPFEVQTYQEAPGLGCGDLTAANAPRTCWLVVVPRGEKEVDGSDRATVLARGDHKLDTSPLSITNWTNRIVFPLAFQPVGHACALGSTEVPLLGVETSSEAVLRWQPALCANSGPVFGLSQVPEAVAESRLTKAAPGMVLLNSAVNPADVPSDRTYVYAPVAISGVTIAALVQAAPAASASSAEKDQAGTTITTVNLTPRVVAKMLTQSYRYNVAGGAQYLTYADGKPYPNNLTQDEDFLKDNPLFRNQALGTTLDILLPLTGSVSNQLLWEWIAADQDATDFVAGLPDPSGMRVNPFYQGLRLPQDQFPKIDPYCEINGQAVQHAPPLCTFDVHPYALDYHEVARSVLRGDPLSRTNWDPQAQPPAYKRVAPNLNGVRHELGVTDTASAARYGLVTARLRNASGAFVAPTAAALQAGAAGMRPSDVPGVKLTDPTTSDAAAYPLATVTYAVTAPGLLTQQLATTYANFLRFAVGTGQTPGTAPGTLPDGYAALPEAMKSQALAAATQVEARVGPPPTDTEDPTDTTTPATTTTPTGTSTGSTNTGGSTNAGGSTVPTTATSTDPTTTAGTTSATGSGPTATAASITAASTTAASTTAASTPASTTTAMTPSVTPTATQRTELTQSLTPTDVVGWVRYVTIIALMLGISAALIGPALPRLVWRPGQRGATPTGTTAPPTGAPQGTGQGTRRAPDDAMATPV